MLEVTEAVAGPEAKMERLGGLAKRADECGGRDICGRPVGEVVRDLDNAGCDELLAVAVLWSSGSEATW